MIFNIKENNSPNNKQNIKFNTITKATPYNNYEEETYRVAVIPLKNQKWVPQNIDVKDYITTSGLRKKFPPIQYSEYKGSIANENGWGVLSYTSRETGETIFISSSEFNIEKPNGPIVVEIEHCPIDAKQRVYARYEDGKLVKVEKGPRATTLLCFIE
ncbi:hypothetical protein J6I39_04330 [bacterium]|nr:hypothetical protein [bacterium]